jgi:hypothetical protein
VKFDHFSEHLFRSFLNKVQYNSPDMFQKQVHNQENVQKNYRLNYCFRYSKYFVTGCWVRQTNLALPSENDPTLPGDLLWSFVESVFGPHIQSWNSATRMGPNPHSVARPRNSKSQPFHPNYYCGFVPSKQICVASTKR